MKTILVWYRNDLRVHDHPALAAAARDGDRVVPVFVLDDRILGGERSSANRNRFLQECLEDLRANLRARGGELVIRSGKPEEALARLADECDASAIYFTADYTPFATTRDARVRAALGSEIEIKAYPGRLIVSSVKDLQTKAGKPHKVFTPFWRNWTSARRRAAVDAPAKLLTAAIDLGEIPHLAELAAYHELSPDVLQGGETAARVCLETFLDGPIDEYHIHHNNLAREGTSRLSAYLHFGCISPREIETMLPASEGANAWHRQLCWRDFYHYVSFQFPDTAKYEFQERYRRLPWSYDEALLQAWQEGKTGYPVVDAAMRQLRREGWMHNRARLIVGSFLTKHLGLDWRLGEAHFMRLLIDGDQANNNGNWQWIASVGVDPAPVFRRLYNPSSQQASYDPDGTYVRRYIPELQNAPDSYLSAPWAMSSDVQEQAGCILGVDYPKPIVDHKVAREAALERYRNI